MQIFNQSDIILLNKLTNLKKIKIIIGCIVIAVFVVIMRAFGAWMLRIDDVIYYQKEILKELKSHKINSQNTKNIKNDNIEIEMDDELKSVIKSANPFKK